MTPKETIAAIKGYLTGCRKIQMHESNTAGAFALRLSQTEDLRELTNMWEGNFASSLQRRQSIRKRMEEVISEVTVDNVPGWFKYFLLNPEFILDCIGEAFNQRATGLLEALEEAKSIA